MSRSGEGGGGQDWREREWRGKGRSWESERGMDEEEGGEVGGGRHVLGGRENEGRDALRARTVSQEYVSAGIRVRI